MKLRAIIFDLDGTLLDTIEDIGDSANTVLARHGYATHTVDEYRHFVGDGARVLVQRMLPEEASSDEIVNKLYREFRSEYARNWNAKTRPYKGVPAMLDGLVERGFRLAVLSNKPDDFTKMCVHEMLPSSTFDVVWGHHDRVPLKPDPTAALGIAAALGVERQECMFVGDNPIDIRTAIAAGMVPVGVAWGFRPAGELESAGAHEVLDQPGDIFNLV